MNAIRRLFAGLLLCLMLPGAGAGVLTHAQLEARFPAPLKIGQKDALDEASWKRLAGRLEEGDHAVLVRWRGRYGPVSDRFVAGTPPDRLTLSQGGLPIEMRDLNLDLRLREDKASSHDGMMVFRVIAQAGLDIGKEAARGHSESDQNLSDSVGR